MTTPGPHDIEASNDVLRRRWLNRYAKTYQGYDAQIRTVLIQGAKDAQESLNALGTSSTFSKGVRAAQIRLAIKETKLVLSDVFGKTLPIIKTGQGAEAEAAVDGLSATDRAYLRAVFGSTGNVDGFIAGQKSSARLGVAHAISQVTQSRYELSTNVYRTRRLANVWVQRQITSSLIVGDSAKTLADKVKSSIRPDTPGGVGYAALRLGRTELNNAFHATSINLSQNRPWIENMAWHLSNVHKIDPNKPEVCEKYSTQVFAVDGVPAKPHPQCRCYVTPILVDFHTFQMHLTSGQYRDWMENNAEAA